MLRTMCLAIATSGLLAPPATAATPPPDAPDVQVRPTGEYLVRFRHAEGRDFTPGGVENFFRHRARLGATFDYREIVGAVLQIQDVRVWGEEGDTLGDFSADGLDMHQAYASIRPTEGLELRLGRQEIVLFNQRLIGNVGFAEQARSFDALRARWDLGDDGPNLDAFYARLVHEPAGDDDRSDQLFGLTVSHRFHPAFVPAVVAVVDRAAGVDRTRATLGVFIEGAPGPGLRYSAEGYVQVGQVGDADLLAWLAAARARYTFDVPVAPFVELFATVISGDDDPGDHTQRSFDTLFATNHGFYGEMDFFTDLPTHTGGRGLMDLGAQLGVDPHPNVRVTLSPHIFLAQEDRGGPGDFGTEIDLRVDWRPIERLRFDLFYGVFLPGGIFEGARGDTPEHFVYSTVATSF